MTDEAIATAPSLFDVEAYVEDFGRSVVPAYRRGIADAELPADAGLARSVIPPGTAATRDFNDAMIGYNFGQQRPVSGNVSLTVGQFYDGDIQTLSFGGGRVAVTKRFSLEPSFSLSRVNLPYGDFITRVIRSRVDYGFSPRMFASALVQYNSGSNSVGANVRLRWEYQPGSELFVVFNEQRDTLARAFPDLANRAFVVKVTRLLRF